MPRMYDLDSCAKLKERRYTKPYGRSKATRAMKHKQFQYCVPSRSPSCPPTLPCRRRGSSRGGSGPGAHRGRRCTPRCCMSGACERLPDMDSGRSRKGCPLSRSSGPCPQSSRRCLAGRRPIEAIWEEAERERRPTSRSSSWDWKRRMVGNFTSYCKGKVER